MSNLLTRTEKCHEEYDNEPVVYCGQCLSLKIRRVPGMEGGAFCDDCGCTHLKEANIHEWEALYKKRYGFTYLNSNY